MDYLICGSSQTTTKLSVHVACCTRRVCPGTLQIGCCPMQVVPTHTLHALSMCFGPSLPVCVYVCTWMQVEGP